MKRGLLPTPKSFPMHKSLLLLTLAALIGLTSCGSYDSFSRTTTGMSLGAMFGSTIGSIVGGYRGADAGTLIGGAVGGVVGAASAEAAANRRREAAESVPRNSYRSAQPLEPSYGRYDETRNYSATAGQLSIENIVFADANNNHVLESGERAYITCDIYNRGTQAVLNVAPVVGCNEKRIAISPTAIIGDLYPGQGMRYKAAVVAQRRLKDRVVGFSILVSDTAGRPLAMQEFSIRTAR